MTFIHVAAFVWKDEVDSGLLGEALSRALREYVAEIEGVVSYDCGPDVGFTPGASDFAVVGRFVSRSVFVDYRDDERHQNILAELIVPNLASRAVVQLGE